MPPAHLCRCLSGRIAGSRLICAFSIWCCWPLAADETLVLGCNLSVASLSHPDRFADIFGRITHQPELSSRLVVEITETYPLVGTAIERVRMIRSLGCRIAIDDFGSGFATPASLLQVSADIVKIDAAFLRDNRRGPRWAR
jgi:EAL domain-containing protein (putative c-di-GMP-specific phosphodiesterase class I)